MSVWNEMAEHFYCGRMAEGMHCFMSNVSTLGHLDKAALWVNPLFDALERGDYYYAADILRYEIAGEK